MDVRLSLPVFSAIGFYLLWVLMLQNGTLDALDAVTSTGVFPTGRPLSTTYLGIPPIDGAISTLVAFTDALTNGAEGSPRLLMIEVVSTLQSGSLWVIIESLRRGSGPLGLVLASFWPLMWNGFGAGVVLPLYYFFEAGKLPPKRNKNDRVSVAHAKALLPTAIITLFLPVFIDLAPPLVSREPRPHNIITALFQATGLYATIIQPLIASQLSGSATPRATTEKAVRRAYFWAGIFSSIGHIYAVSTSLLSEDPNVSFSRTFVPAMSDVVPGTSRTVFEGTLLFLKYDNLIITITSALWQWLSLKPYLNAKSRIDYVSTAFLITLSTLVLGPGGSVSFAHYLRESWIR